MIVLQMQLKRLSQQYYRLGHLILVMLLGLVSDPVEAQQLNEIRSSPPVCDDFLARWNQKPAAVEFVRCNIIHHEQVDRLAAIYHVKGYEAIEIEKFLQKQFGMASLRFACCGWAPDTEKSAPPYGWYVDTMGTQFQVYMSAGETLVNDRGAWHKIPKFRITVETYLGEF